MVLYETLKSYQKGNFQLSKTIWQKEGKLLEFAIGRNTRETKALISNEFQ